MGKFTGLLVCSDLDGTLLAHEPRISQENLDAIAYFCENGGRFTLATGRKPSILNDPRTEGLICNAPVIFLNGTLVYDCATGQVLSEFLMDDDYTETLLQLCGSFDALHHVIFFPKRAWDADFKLDSRDTDGIRTMMRQGTYKLYLQVLREASDAVKAEALRITDQAYDVTRSSPVGVEINLKHACKGAACRRLAQSLGADTLICIGDYENDRSMIEEADIGVAMGNAVDSLKAVADRITADAADNGFAAMIYGL